MDAVAAGSLCPQCKRPPAEQHGGQLISNRERHIVRGRFYIFDCRCGYVFRVKDRWGEFRSTFLTHFVRVWRKLEPGVPYLLGSLADAVGVTSKILLRLIEAVVGANLDGKPFYREVYGIEQIVDKNGEVKIVYRPHPAVLKDLDPEEGEPWPYDVLDLDLSFVSYEEPLINEPLQLRVRVDYCFTSPTTVFVGLEEGGRWIAFAQRVVCGEGSQEFILRTLELKRYGRVNYRLRMFHKEGGRWVGDASREVTLDLRTVKCLACGRGLDLGQTLEARCKCGTLYWVRGERVYALKPDEAFSYDFRDGWISYWRLACPSCGSAASFESSSGRWVCPSCGYVQPKHRFPSFRCCMPCGHEGTYPMTHLLKGLLRCQACGQEAGLPPNVRAAWSNVDDTGTGVALAVLALIGLGLGGLALGGGRR
jgi:ribosomal protein S27AE